MWEKINEIFPNGGTFLDGVYYTNDEIQKSGVSDITTYIQKPVREMLENVIEYKFYSNGDMTARTIYNIFPPKKIDGIPLLNVYAQKMINTILGENNDK